MPNKPNMLDEKILLDLLQKTFTHEKFKEIQKLFGHASARTYYRVSFESAFSIVVMQMPEGASSISEEISKNNFQLKEIPFVNIQKYLSSHYLPTPKIYLWDESSGLMFLEDVGDQHLELCVKDQSESLQIYFYKQAIDLLVKMQKNTPVDQSCIAFNRSFDFDLLNWEFDHFLEYGIEDRFSLKVSKEYKDFFVEQSRKINSEIIQIPTCFVHRDFQSRNLMFHQYQLYLLDYQDALIGPYVYDLVSLLRDSYIALSPQALNTLLKYYLDTRSKNDLAIADESLFYRHFHLQTLQRKLKDTGRFQYIATVKHNPNFLVSVPHSLNYVSQAFDALPDYKAFKIHLAQYLPEWADFKSTG